MFNYTYKMWINDVQRIGKKNERRKEYTAAPAALTVKQYIDTYQPPTEKRISKKGTELVKVFYPNGKIKEYPTAHIDTTTANEF